jgi:hypothetical protein
MLESLDQPFVHPIGREKIMHNRPGHPYQFFLGALTINTIEIVQTFSGVELS